MRMADKVQETSKEGESKVDELNIKTLFSPPEVEEVKEEKGVDETVSPTESETEDPKELQTKLSALTKELNRVRKSKSESSAEVQEVRVQLADLQGQLKAMSSSKSTEESVDNRLAKYTDEQLLRGQTEWEDAVYDEREAMRRARSDNDDAAFNRANRDAAVAKSTLNSIRKELLERTKRVGSQEVKAQTEAQELVQEISTLYESAYETLPDLNDKDSELFKAGNKVFNRHPKLMKQLGPLAELVATVVALSENPKLIPNNETGKAKDARKELLSEINAQAEKSLIKGKGSPNKRVATDFEAMPKSQFDDLIYKLKQG